MDFSGDSIFGGFVDTSLVPAPKRIIICCDGTWQSSVSNVTNIPSNVTRIARYLTKIGKDNEGKIWQQTVYYDAGIGTGVSDLEAKRQGGTGSGFVGNVIEAYNFIVNNYNLGDQIFCFGFSRGAYTARVVAGLVTDIGIIRPRDMQDFPELYRLYQAHEDSHVFRKSPVWREWVEGKRLFDPKHKNMQSETSFVQWEKRPHYAAPESTRWVEAVGVFDTVGSLGIPEVEGMFNKMKVWVVGKAITVEKFGFHNVALSPYIRNAYHAVALDEHRKPFSPTLWHLPADGVAGIRATKSSISELKDKWHRVRDDASATEKQRSDAWMDLVDAEMYDELKNSKSNLLQVWFPGVHINIGGGSDDLLNKKESDFEQIAMITLHWMVAQLERHLSFDNFASLSNMDRFLLMRPAVDELIANQNKNHWLVKKINGLIAQDSKQDPWNDGNKTRSLVFAADALRGWATGPIIDSFEGEMKAAGSLDRTPGRYKESTTQSGTTKHLGPTNEHIHPCVQYRMAQLGSGYKPVALTGFKRQPKLADNKKVVGFEWVKGDIHIPEYQIDQYGIERWCAVSSAAREFLGRLDKECGIDSLQAQALDAPPQSGPENVGFQPNTSF